MKPPWDLYGTLPDLIILLRQHGYVVGTEQCVAAQRLLVALAASGDELQDPRRLGTLLSPVFSTTPQEQKSFLPLYEQWLAGHAGLFLRLRTGLPLRPAEPEPQFQVHGAKTFLRGLIVPTVFTLVVVVSLILASRGGGGSKKGSDEAAGAGFGIASPAAIWLVAGLTVASILFVAVASGRFRARRPMQFAKGRVPGSPDVEDWMAEGAGHDLTRTLALRRAAQGLRRRREWRGHILYAPATVEETARKGLFTPIYGTRRRAPEYLVLIDRKNFDDPLARLMDEVVKGLIRHDVHIERFYFQEDPRLCRRDGPRDQEPTRRREDPRLRRQDGPKAQYFTLQELAARYPEHNLIVFSDGAGLFNPNSGLPRSWLKMFSVWTNRALLTTESYEDSYQRRALTELGFLVLPAGKFGLASLEELVDAGGKPEVDSSKHLKPLPAMLQDDPGRWLDSYPPPPEVVKEFCSQLRQFLGREGYLWLCACAVYPALQWDLTLALRDERFPRRNLDEELWSLMRLPWFQHGSMPDWLRTQLIKDMPTGYEARVRERLEVVLRGGQGASEAFALGFVPWLRRDGRPGGEGDAAHAGQVLSKEGTKTMPEPGDAQEYVFLSFMSGFRQNRLSVLIPAGARSLMLGGDGSSVRELGLLNAVLALFLLGYLLLVIALAAMAGPAGIYILLLGGASAVLVASIFIDVERQVLRWEKAKSSSLGAEVLRWGLTPASGIWRPLTTLSRVLQNLLAKFQGWWRRREFLVRNKALRPSRPTLRDAHTSTPTRLESELEVGKVAADQVSFGTHPRGLYVLFAAELWERFSFYSMLAMFALYMRDTTGQGFAWSVDDTQALVSNYLMFVYASPLVGGWIADKRLGYRKSVMIGGLFFMAGHLLLSFRSIGVVYAALACLVVGNGFFKPNVSAMVGNLYPEGSHLKDRAYSIFYMGINLGAFAAPIVMTIVQLNFGYHPAFAVAAGGMLISVLILWRVKRHIEIADSPGHQVAKTAANAAAVAVAVDAPPASVSGQNAIDALPDWMRVGALVVIFLIVIVFWMIFHQNSTTITYWGDENTDWKVSGIISNSINPVWVLLLTFPLVWFWGWLDRKGLEPATPTKMVIGMVITSAAFFVLFIAARTGEASLAPGADPYAYKLSPLWLLGAYGVLTLGELMLSPMGLSLVSKVAPVRMRGLMMGCWFIATAIGNKLTQIGQLWDDWLHSTYWLFLSVCALVMAGILLAALRPLKKAMPGV